MIESERILKEFQDRAYAAEAVATAAEKLFSLDLMSTQHFCELEIDLRQAINAWRQVHPRRVTFTSPMSPDDSVRFEVSDDDAPDMRNGEMTWRDAKPQDFQPGFGKVGKRIVRSVPGLPIESGEPDGT